MIQMAGSLRAVGFSRCREIPQHALLPTNTKCAIPRRPTRGTAVAFPVAVNATLLGTVAASQSEGEITMNRSSTRAFRWLAPLLGITLLSGVASAKVITEIWQVKGVHTPADEAKIHTALTQLPSVTDAVVHMTTVR